MIKRRHVAPAAGLLMLGITAVPSQAQRPMRDPDGMPVVMSDTQAWCMHFAAEVGALRRSLEGPHPEADRLVREGRRLCVSGHVRLGITRLRYAMMELREN